MTINPELDPDDLPEQPPEPDFEAAEPELCLICNGSGEGRYSRLCWCCKGLGEV